MKQGTPRADLDAIGDFKDALQTVLSHIPVRARRLLLTTPGVEATVPMIRGVWGAALHRLDRQAYREAFEGGANASSRTPGYILRPAPPDPDTAPAIEWISLGPALACDSALVNAWKMAARMGLGPRRRPFDIRSVISLHPGRDAQTGKTPAPAWTLDKAVAGSPIRENDPCALVFNAPLRLIRKSRIVSRPALRDIVIGGLRRVRALAPETIRHEMKRLWEPSLDIAEKTNARAWRGQRLDLIRWSARQQTEIELRAVAGSIELPDGPGPLLPLFAALQWIHIGKGASIGLGQLTLRQSRISKNMESPTP